jgi:hypothetical protein
MVAAIRPDSWNLPLFLHVLGAITLFGGTAAVGVLSFAARRDAGGNTALLSRLSFRTFVFLVLPAWILMRAGAQWTADKEHLAKHPPGWVNVGFGVSEVGLLLLVIAAVLAWTAQRRGGVGRAAAVVPWLAWVYLGALAVAWFFMTGKPGD